MADGTLISPYCECDVGWSGEKCDQCIPHPGCPPKSEEEGSIDRCKKPWDCRCVDPTELGMKYCCDFVPSTCVANTGRQSPIDIVQEDAVVTAGAMCPNIDFSIYKNNANVPNKVRFAPGHWINTGKDFSFVFDNPDNHIITDCDGQTYRLAETHFHWGTTDSDGSEHTINGQQFSAEMHLVHTNTKYQDNFGQFSDGFLVIGIIFDQGASSSDFSTVYLSNLIEKYQSMANGQVGIKLVDSFGIDLEKYMKEAQLLSTSNPGKPEKFYRYLGSLTTGECDEAVTWIVAAGKDDQGSIAMAASTLVEFRELTDKHGNPIAGNVRPTQPIAERSVEFFNF